MFLWLTLEAGIYCNYKILLLIQPVCRLPLKPPSCIYCSSGLTDHSHRTQKGQYSPTTAFLSVAAGISTHRFLACSSFPVIFLRCNIFILHIQHHSSTSTSYSVVPVRLAVLLLIGFLVSTKPLRHLLPQGYHLVQAFGFCLDFEVSSNCTITLVSLPLLHCLTLHMPNPCHCILSFSCIVIVLFISLMAFFRGKLNISLVHHADHMS